RSETRCTAGVSQAGATDELSREGRPASRQQCSNSAARHRWPCLLEPMMIGVRIVARVGMVVLLSVGLLAALVAGGLFVAPTMGVAAYTVDTPPRHPPIIPPSVPPGAREDWAVWSYVDKINQAWGRDWPLVIEWFEELDARYPGN